MKNKFLVVVALLVTMLYGGHKVMAQSVTIDGITYSYSSEWNGAYVSYINDAVTHANILSGVTLNGMVYPVETIYIWDTESRQSSLQSVTLPSTLKRIEYGAFYNCTLLKEIVIPDGVTSIGSYAFYNCNSLENVNIPKGVTSIGSYAFQGCSSLKSIDIPSGVKNIDYYAFGGCYSLESVYITDFTAWLGVKFNDNESNPLYYAKNLYLNGNLSTDLVFPSSVTTIGQYQRFNGLTSLKTVKFEDGLTKLPEGLFSGCSSLTSVKLPGTLVAIPNSLFYGCKQLVDVTIPTGVTTIGNSAFYDCTSLESINIPNSVTNLGSSVFSGCKSLKLVELSSSLAEIPSQTFYDCTSLESINIPNSVTNLGSSVFSGCKSLKLVELSSSLAEIPSQTFYDCTSLESINIPNSVTNLGSSVFSGCKSLKLVELSSSLAKIPYQAFYDCTSLASINIPNSVKRFASSAFVGCTSLLRVDATDLSSWFDIEFENFSSNPLAYADSFCVAGVLKDTINIPEGVTSLKSYTLGAGSFIKEFILPSTIDTIEYEALPSGLLKFKCNAIEPPFLKGYTEVSDEGYEYYYSGNLGNVQTIFVPKDCRKNYKNVDPWASKVIVDGDGKSVNVHVATAGMMGEEILGQADYLSDVNFLTVSGTLNSADINNIKNSMPNLLTIDMSKTDLTSIPDNMFFDRKSLLDVILPLGATSIGAGAFHNCISLESVILPEGLNTLNSGSSYDNYYDNNGTVGCFSDCSSLKTIQFPSTLRNIGDGTFYNCDALTKMEIPADLDYIGSYAFANCSSLYSIQLPRKVGSFGSYVFRDSYALYNIGMPKCIGTLEQNAFCYSHLKRLEVDTLKYIHNGAFYGSSSLKEVIIKNGLAQIGDIFYDTNDDYYYSEERKGAFEYCHSLERIELPDGLQKIGNRSFADCSSLISLDVPEGVSYIGQDAFSGCSVLQTVNLPSTLKSCGSTPFLNCNKLTKVTCTSLFPPVLADGLLSLENMGLAVERTLYVPDWTIKKYKLTSGWAAFSEILPLNNVYPENLIIDDYVTLALPVEGFPDGYKTNLNLAAGNLHLTGNETLPLSTFRMYQERYYQNYEYESGWGYDIASVLLNEATITADNVVTDLRLSSGNWHFLSFPYDVKVSDIKTSGDWVIRYYDGQARADMNYNNTWVTVPYDGILHAGQGYIWSSSNGSFTVSAVDNDNKNRIFANDILKIELKEYLSDYTSNNSWNLIGNPYPCYYDTRFMKYTAPITVWDRENRTYVAYSPVDDNYILTPLEAFFVQCPAGMDSVAFAPDGRQTNTSIRTIPMMVTAGAKSAPRQVFNVLLGNDQYTDRTRFVINANAQINYEMGCDAAKFMSGDANAPQLFTIEGNDKLAINERPFADGKVALGVYVGAAGTYTLSLETMVNQKVTLIDHLTGTETDMTSNSYTFEAEVGTINDRFTLLIGDGAYSVDETIIEETVKVVPVVGGISVVAAGGAEVVVYNAAGVQIVVANGTSANFNVAPGLYVVKVGNISHKVSVSK